MKLIFQKFIKKTGRIIPVYAWVPLTAEVLLNSVVYWGAMRLTEGRQHYNMALPLLDERVPLLCWTTIIYFGCYLFWIANYILIARQGEKPMYRLLSADFLAKIICLICFLLFPTTIVRPEIAGNGFWENTMRFLYWADEPSNLFPSIHCLTSWFCYIGIRGNRRVAKGYRMFSCLMALAVCISTLTTKQHVFVDVPAGILLAEAMYLAAEKFGFADIYRRASEWITQRLPAGLERDA